MAKVILFLTLFCWVFLPFNVSAKDVIYWQTYHQPPGSIQLGEFKGQGFLDRVLSLVIENLPEYDHAMPMSSLARALSDIESGKHACHPALHASEERKEYMYFSQPAMMNAMNAVIGKSDDILRLENESNEALHHIFTQSTFALVKGRAYSGGYDEFVASQVTADQTVFVSSETIDTLFQLVAMGRVDFTIAYPFELQYFLSKQEHTKNRLRTFNVPKTSAYSVGYIACPKTPWGKEVIEKVDKVLDRIKPTKEYLAAMTSWAPSEQITPEFRRFYQEVFLSKEKP